MAITAAQAQAAYLKIFDVNDLKERMQLFKYVLADARTSMLFLLNCSPNQVESEAAFSKVVDDPNYCYELLKKGIEKLTQQQRLQAISSVIKEPKLAWDVVWGTKLTQEEKLMIYKAHYAHYLKDKTIDNYWAQWNAFGDIFPAEELDRFIDMVYGCESYEAWDMAETLLKYGNLTAEQREKLDGKLVANILK